MAPIFARVVQTRDRYGLHAYLTALENADLRGRLEAEIQTSTKISDEEKGLLQSVLETGALPADKPAEAAQATDKVALLP
jgi:hypothetical protein